MRCNPSKWLWGIIPIAFLSWLAVQVEHTNIESDLARRTEESLSRKGLDWASPVYSGRDGVLVGKASDEHDQPRAVAAMRDIWGARVVRDETGLLQRIDRYFWSVAVRNDGKAVLSGYVPSQNARQTILATAQRAFGRRKVFDDMKLARGAPRLEVWMPAALFTLAQAAELKTGTAELSELDLSIEGVAASADDYRAVNHALREQLPRRVKLVSAKITPPRIDPYAWTAKWNGNEVTLSGYMPSEAARRGIERQVQQAFPNASLTDRADFGTGAPPAWERAVAVGLRQLANLKSGYADIKANVFVFSGTAKDEATAASVRRAVKAEVPQNYKVRDDIRYMRQDASVSGYMMAISHRGGEVVVRGQVPSEAARLALVDAVKTRFPDVKVVDNLSVAPGAPQGWQQCIIAGLAPLPKLSQGETVLVDNRLSVTGETGNYGDSKSVPQEVAQAAGQACVAETKITFTGEIKNTLSWRAVRDDRGVVILEGEVPDDNARGKLLDAAHQIFRGMRVSDRMRIVPMPEQPWLNVALNSLGQLGQLQTGELTMKGGDILLKGLVSSEDVASEVHDTLTGNLPEGYKARAAIEIMTAPQREASLCQDMMRDASARGVIEFSRASADLTRSSQQTLNELAEIANECPAARIEIEGHTDAEGTDERNQRLSDRRAASVANYLAAHGVERQRMSTVGYGSTQPIADNSTPEGRARNRRIEFFVRPN